MGTPRHAWLDSGLDILREAGIQAITIDVLCKRLGRSKGSFYFHFANRQAYLEALLAHWEDLNTHRIIALVQGVPDPNARLHSLLDASLGLSPALEVAIRAWAQQEPAARAAQERVDTRRRAFCQHLATEATGDPTLAETLGEWMYLTFVGAQHVIPPTDRSALERIFHHFERALRPAPLPDTEEEEI